MQLLKSQLLAKETDVNKVQLQTAQLSTQKELISSKYEQVLNALKFAMGIDINRKMEIDTTISYQNERNYNTELSLDVRFAKTQNRLLTSELNTLKNARLPSLSLFGSYGTTGFGYDKSPNDFLKFFPIGFGGIQLAYPLFNGTVTERKINQKNIELQNSVLQINLATEQNNMLIVNAKRQRFVAQKSVKTTLSQIELAQSIYQQTALQQKQGVATLTDVLLADNTVREAQQTYLSAIVEYLKADLELKKLTGNVAIKN
jgi:outer membrane protein TolC